MHHTWKRNQKKTNLLTRNYENLNILKNYCQELYNHDKQKNLTVLIEPVQDDDVKEEEEILLLWSRVGS